MLAVCPLCFLKKMCRGGVPARGTGDPTPTAYNFIGIRAYLKARIPCPLKEVYNDK